MPRRAQLVDAPAGGRVRGRLDERGVDARDRRERAHAAGVRAGVAVADALEVARGRERERALAVAQREQRQLVAVEELLDHDRRRRRSRCSTSIASSAARASRSSRGDHDALAGRQPVGLDAPPGSGRSPPARPRPCATTVYAAVGTPAASMISLANAFEPSSRAAAALGPERRRRPAASASTKPVDERRLGADDDEVDAARAAASAPGRRRRRAARVGAIPALPGAQNTSGACGERSSARTIACSRPPPPTTRTFVKARR